MTSSVDILDYMLGKFPNLKEAYDFYQNFLLSISNVNVNIKMYKKWKIKMYNLGSTIHQLSYHQ